MHGAPELVVQDASEYQALLDRLDRAEALLGIHRGLESKREGRGEPLDEAFASLREELGAGEQVE